MTNSHKNLEEPLFHHDCKKCTFLGRFNNHDLYACTTTVIARFGDRGPEYISGLSLVPCVPELEEAFKRAKNINYTFEI